MAASLDHRAQLLQEAFLDFPCHICPVQLPSGLCCPVMPPPLISRLCLWAPSEHSCSEAGEKRDDPEGWVLKRQGSGLPATGLPLGLWLPSEAALAPVPALSWGCFSQFIQMPRAVKLSHKEPKKSTSSPKKKHMA